MSRHHHHDPAPPACCSCCACACACGCSPPAPCGGGGYYPAPPPQPAPGSDQLLHAIAAHLLLNSAPPPPPQAQPPPQHQHQPHPQPPPPQHQPHPQPPQPQHQPHPQPPQPQHQPQPHPQPPPNPAVHHANLYASYAYQHQQQQTYPQPPAAARAPPQQHQNQPNPPDHGQLLLHSLLRRVAALETTLPHVLPSPPAPHPQQPNPRRHHRAHAHQEDPRSPSPPPRRARRGPPSERELAARTIQEHFRHFLARRSRTLRQLKELAMLRSKAASLRASLSGSGRRRCKDPMAISEAALGMLYRLDGIQGGDPMIREGKHALSRELGRILEFVDKVLLKEQQEMGEDGAFDDYPEGCHGMNRPTVNWKVSFHGNEANTEADESSESSSSTEADETKAANSKKSVNGKPGLAAPVPVHMESRRTGGEM